jgi:DNA-binding NarL/FixJ family response regulator
MPKHRFYYAFDWKKVVEYIKNSTKGFVLIAASESDASNRLEKALSEVSDRVIGICSLYDDGTADKIIDSANSPGDGLRESLEGWAGNTIKSDAKKVSLLVLVDHKYRTNNLHRILNETNLTVISTTERFNKTFVGKDQDGDEQWFREPDASWLYGRPPLPDFDNLTDEQHELYLQDGVNDLSDLIPVYDFSVQGVDFNEMVTASVIPRTPLVLLNDAPMLWSESISELFAWRGTGKTLWAMSLGLHLAAGKDMAQFTIPAPQKVLYVEGELPASQLKERMQQLSQGLTIPAGGFTLISKANQPRNKSQESVSINSEAGRAAIEAKIEQTGATVLILDSIASLAQIDTNKEEHWIPIIEWLVELRCKGMCVIYLQQAGKGGEQRGHSVSEDRIDLAIKLTASKNSNGASFKMMFTKQRQGSLTPLQLTCTQGVWAVDDDSPKKVSKKAPPTTRTTEQQILDALEAGESQRSIAKRLNTSFSTISKLKKESTNGVSDDLSNNSNQG